MPDPKIVPLKTSFEQYQEKRNNPNTVDIGLGETSGVYKAQDYKEGSSVNNVSFHAKQREQKEIEELRKRRLEQRRIEEAKVAEAQKEVAREKINTQAKKVETLIDDSYEEVENENGEIETVFNADKYNEAQRELEIYKTRVESNPDAFAEERNLIEKFEEKLEKSSDSLSREGSWNSVVDAIGAAGDVLESTSKGLKEVSQQVNKEDPITSAINSTFLGLTEYVGKGLSGIKKMKDNYYKSKALEESEDTEETKKYKEARATIRAVEQPAIKINRKLQNDVIEEGVAEIERLRQIVSTGSPDQVNKAEDQIGSIKVTLQRARDKRRQLDDILSGEDDLSFGGVWKEVFSKNIVDFSTVYDYWTGEDAVKREGEYMLVPNMREEIGDFANSISSFGKTFDDEYYEPYLKETGKSPKDLTEQDMKAIWNRVPKHEQLAFEAEMLGKETDGYVQKHASFGYKTQLGVSYSMEMMFAMIGAGKITSLGKSGLKALNKTRKIQNALYKADKAVGLSRLANSQSVLSKGVRTLGKTAPKLTEQLVMTGVQSAINPMFINQQFRDNSVKGFIKNNEGEVIAGSAGQMYKDYEIDRISKVKKKYKDFVDSVEDPNSLSPEKRKSYDYALGLLGEADTLDEGELTLNEMISQYKKADTSMLGDYLRGFAMAGIERVAETGTSRGLSWIGKRARIGGKAGDFLKRKGDVFKSSYNNTWVGRGHNRFNRLSEDLLKVGGNKVINSYPTEVVEEYVAELGQSLLSFTQSTDDGLSALNEYAALGKSTDFATEVLAQTAVIKAMTGGLGASNVLAGRTLNSIRTANIKKQQKKIKDITKQIEKSKTPKETKSLKKRLKTAKENLNTIKDRGSLTSTKTFATDWLDKATGSYATSVEKKVQQRRVVNDVLRELQETGSLDPEINELLEHLDTGAVSDVDFKDKVKELEDRGDFKEAALLRNSKMSGLLENVVSSDSVTDLITGLNAALDNKDLGTQGKRALQRTLNTAKKIDKHIKKYGESDRTSVGVKILAEQGMLNSTIEDLDRALVDMDRSTTEKEFKEMQDSGDIKLGSLSSEEAMLVLNDTSNPFDSETDSEKHEDFETLKSDLDKNSTKYEELDKYIKARSQRDKAVENLAESRENYRQVTNPTREEKISENFIRYFQNSQKNKKDKKIEDYSEEDLRKDFDKQAKLYTAFKELSNTEKEKVYNRFLSSLRAQKKLNKDEKDKKEELDKLIKDAQEKYEKKSEPEKEEVLDEADKGVIESLEDAKGAVANNSKDIPSEEPTQPKKDDPVQEEPSGNKESVSSEQEQVIGYVNSLNKNTVNKDANDRFSYFKVIKKGDRYFIGINPNISEHGVKEIVNSPDTTSENFFKRDKDQRSYDSSIIVTKLAEVRLENNKVVLVEKGKIEFHNTGQEYKNEVQEKTVDKNQETNPAQPDDPFANLPDSTDDQIDLGNQGEVSKDNPIIKAFEDSIVVIANYFETKGNKEGITLEDVFNMMIINENNPGELMSLKTLGFLVQAYKNVYDRGNNSEPAFREGEIQKLEDSLKNILENEVSPKQGHDNLKKGVINETPLGLRDKSSETPSTTKKLNKDQEEAEEKKKRREEIKHTTVGDYYGDPVDKTTVVGQKPRLGFLALAYNWVTEKSGLKRKTSNYSELQYKSVNPEQWIVVDPRPLLNPDNPREFNVEVEIAQEEDWGKVPISLNELNEQGENKLISFAEWVRRGEANDPNFRETNEFRDKQPIYTKKDGKVVSYVHEQDWFNGYNVQAPFPNDAKSDDYIHPSKAMQNPLWAEEINNAKARNGRLRDAILLAKDPVRQLKVVKKGEGKTAYLPEKNTLTIEESNPQAELVIQTGKSIKAFVANNKDFKSGKKELVNDGTQFNENTVGQTWMLQRVGSRINDKGKKVEQYRAFKILRQGDNNASEYESVLRAFAIHKALNGSRSGNKKYDISEERAEKIDNQLGRKHNTSLSTNQGFLRYMTQFFKVSPEFLESVNANLEKKVIDSEKRRLISEGVSEKEAESIAVNSGKQKFKANRGTNYLPLIMVLEEAMAESNPLKRADILDDNLRQTSSKASLSSSKTVPQITNDGVVDTGLTYKQYLLRNLRTNVKAYNMAQDGKKPLYTPVIQPVFEVEDSFEDLEFEERRYNETEKKAIFGDLARKATQEDGKEDNQEETEKETKKSISKEEEAEITDFIEGYLKSDIDSYLEDEVDDQMSFEQLKEIFTGNIEGITFHKARAFVSLITNTIVRKADFRDKLSNDSIKEIKKVALKRLRIHNASVLRGINERISLLENANELTANQAALLKALKDNASTLNKTVENFDGLFKVALKSVKQQAKIDSDEYKDEGLDEEQVNEKNYSKESIQETVKSKATGKLKMLLSGIPVYDSKGNIEYGYAGIPEYMSLDDAYNLVLKALSVGIDPNADFDYMISKLEETDNPALQEVIDRLKNADGQLKNQFVTNSAMHSLTSRFVMYQTDKDGNTSLKVYDTNASTTKRAVVDNWKNNTRATKLYDSTGTFNTDEARRLKRQFEEFPTNFEDLNLSELRKWFEDLGIELHEKTWNSLITTGVVSGNKSYLLEDMYKEARGSRKGNGIIIKAVEFLNSGISNPKEYGTDGIGLYDDITGMINGLAETEAMYNPELISLVFRDSGKTISTLTPPKFITDEISKLLNSVGGDQEYINEIKQFAYSSNSLTLQMLEESQDFRDFLKVHHISLTALKDRNKKESREKKANDLDVPEFLMTALGFFQDRKMPTLKEESSQVQGKDVRMAHMINPTMSDKDTALAMGTVVFDLVKSKRKSFNYNNETGEITGLSDSMLDVLYDYTVENQVKKILEFHAFKEESSTNIKGYDAAADLFIDMPGLNSIQIDGVNLAEYLRVKGKAGVPLNEVTAEIQESVKEFLSEMVKHEVEKKVEVVNNFGLSKGKGSTTNAMVDYQYINAGSDTKLDPTQPGPIKLAMYDFVFNNLIFNSEVNKLFVSDLAQYHKHKFPKNKSKYELSTAEYVKMAEDTGVNIGKRLALLIAPGRKIAKSDQKYRQIFLEDPVDISENMYQLIDWFYDGNEEAKESLNKLRKIQLTMDSVENIRRQNINNKKNIDYNTFNTTKRLEEEYEKELENLKSIVPQIAGYLELESADAQEYTTVGEHLNVMYLYGQLTEQQYNNITDAYNKGGFKSLSKSDQKVVMQPIKPVHTGIYNDLDQGVRRVVYIKSSSIPLIPELTKGTVLDNLRVEMEAMEEATGEFVRASYQTANKVGALTNTVNVRNPESISKMGIDNTVSLRLDRNNFRIQQDVPHKSSKKKQDKISMGTQIFKLLLGDGVLDVEGNVFPYKGKMVDAKTLKEEFDRSFSEIFENAKSSLYDELGVTNPEDVKKPEYKQKLSALLKKEAETRGYDIKTIAGLEVNADGNFEIPLWLSSDSNKFEALLNSIITNRLMKFKLPGNGFVAASENGVSEKKEFQSLSASEKNDIIYLDGWNGRELQATKYEDGSVKAAQVMVESKFKDSEGNLIDLFEDYNGKEGKYIQRNTEGRLELKEGMIDKELFNMFSFRTPTSAHVSGSSIEIVGILPSQAGDQMVVPKNFTQQKGLDFDVDKESAYMLNHFVDENGRVRVLNDEFKEQLDALKGQNLSVNPYLWDHLFMSDELNLSSVIADKDTRFNGSGIPKKKRALVYRIARLKYENRSEELDSKVTNLINVLFDEELNSYQEDVSLEIKRLEDEIGMDPKEYEKVLNVLVKDFESSSNPIDRGIEERHKRKLPAKSVEKLNTKIAENDFIRTHLAVFNSTSDDIQRKVNKILSMDYAGAQADMIEAANKEGNKNKEIQKLKDQAKARGENLGDLEAVELYEKQQGYFTLLSHDYQKSKMDLGAIGKAAIGVYSVAITFASQVQQNIGKRGIPMDEFRIGEQVSSSLGAVESETPGYLNSDMLAEKQNTATDNEKEQILGRVGVDEISITADAHGTLRGFGKDSNGNSILYQLLSQPIVKEYNKRLKESRGLLGEYVKEEDLINQMLQEADPSSGIVYEDTGMMSVDMNFVKYDEVEWLEGGKYSADGIPEMLSLGSRELNGDTMLSEIEEGNTRGPVAVQALKTYIELLSEGKGYIGKIGALNNNQLGKSTIGITVKKEKLKSALRDPDIARLFGKPVPKGTKGAFEFSVVKLSGEVVDYAFVPTTPQGKIAMEGIMMHDELFSGLFPYQNEYVLMTLNSILDSKGISEDFRTDESYEKIIDEMKKYIFSSNEINLFSGDPNLMRKKLMTDTNNNLSLSTYLRQTLKSSNPDFKKGINALKNNALVGKKLKFVPGKEADQAYRISYDNANSEHIDDGELYESLGLLMINNQPLPSREPGVPYDTRTLVEDLIRYSYLEGGIQRATEFTKYIPVEVLAHMGMNGVSITDKLRGLDDRSKDSVTYASLLANFEKQFFQNNPNEARFAIKDNTTPLNKTQFEYNTKDNNPSAHSNFLIRKDKKGNISLYQKTDTKPLISSIYTKIPIMNTKRISQYFPQGDIQDINEDLQEFDEQIEESRAGSVEGTLSNLSRFSTVKQALEYIEKNTEDPKVKALVEYYKDKVGDVQFTVSDSIKPIASFQVKDNIKTVRVSPKKAADKYDSTDEIFKLILHETNHALTLEELSKFFQKGRDRTLSLRDKTLAGNPIPSYINDLVVVENEARDAIFKHIEKTYNLSSTEIKFIMDTLKDTYSGRNKQEGVIEQSMLDKILNGLSNKPIEDVKAAAMLAYPTLNLGELYAGMINNEELFNVLNNTKYKNTKDSVLKRLIDSFVELAKKMFPGLNEDSIAQAVVLNNIRDIESLHKTKKSKGTVVFNLDDIGKKAESDSQVFNQQPNIDTTKKPKDNDLPPLDSYDNQESVDDMFTFPNSPSELDTNKVQYSLDVVDRLLKMSEPKDTKAKRKGYRDSQPEALTLRVDKEQYWRKQLSKKGVSNTQINRVFNYLKSNNIEEISTKELALELASKFSFAVEINTAKRVSAESSQKVQEQSSKEEFDSIDVKPDFTGDPLAPTYEKRTEDYIYELEQDPETGEEKYIKYSQKKSTQNTEYYSNLKVPGGTNYTENEIATPLITPNIKGHAQFSTDNGIGWFRSDEEATSFKEGNQKEVDDLPFPTNDFIEAVGDKGSKTRRVLELQSDLFQKARDKKDLTSIEKHEDSEKITLDEFDTSKAIVLEETEGQVIGYTENGVEYYQHIDDNIAYKRFPKNNKSEKNQFLQLLNKDNNWVRFFIQSIIQDSAKKGYKQVLFPKGDTAAKIEGHQTLEEFRRQKEDRIKELEKEKQDIEQYKDIPTFRYKTKQDAQNAIENNPQLYNYIKEVITDKVPSERQIKAGWGKVVYHVALKEYVISKLESKNQEIKTHKQELADAESGQTQLSSIAKFYEEVVTNTLKKSNFNPTEITDEYGNKWNEVKLDKSFVNKQEEFVHKEEEFSETQDSYIISKIPRQGMTLDLLKGVSKYAKDPYMKSFADHLINLEIIPNSFYKVKNVNSLVPVSKKNSVAVGSYSPYNNEISLVNYTDSTTIIHEVLHLYTYKELIHNSSKEAKEWNSFYKKTKNILEKEGIDTKKIYGMTDASEFLSEIFTDMELRKLLLKINYKKDKSLWDKFTDIVYSILKIEDNKSFQEILNNTLLQEGLSKGLNLVNSNIEKSPKSLKSKLDEKHIELVKAENSLRNLVTPSFIKFSDEQISKTNKKIEMKISTSTGDTYILKRILKGKNKSNWIIEDKNLDTGTKSLGEAITYIKNNYYSGEATSEGNTKKKIEKEIQKIEKEIFDLNYEIRQSQKYNKDWVSVYEDGAKIPFKEESLQKNLENSYNFAVTDSGLDIRELGIDESEWSEMTEEEKEQIKKCN